MPLRTVPRQVTPRQVNETDVPAFAGRRHRPDYWLAVLCLLLAVIGLVVVYSISPALSASAHVNSNYFVSKQAVAIGLSIVAFGITSQVPLAWWKRAAKPAVIVAGLATLITLVTPTSTAYPQHRWVQLGSFSFQSVELLKFALLLAAATFFTERLKKGHLNNTERTLKPLLIATVITGVIVAGPKAFHGQSDLGSMAVIVAMIGVMAFVIGLEMRKLFIVAAIVLLCGAVFILPSTYRRERLLTFMHPAADCQNAGYQACNALIAVGSGGMIGLGLGGSVQAYGYTPEAANDSIFSVYAEMFGFIGAVLLLGLYVGLFSRIKSIAERAPDDFSRLIAVGVLSWISIQTLINIGAMIGLLPLKGITLPFISYGGTSVVFIAAAVGLVFQISHFTSFARYPRVTGGNDNDHRSDGRRLGGAYHPDFGSRA